jgi:hypothetical protein
MRLPNPPLDARERASLQPTKGFKDATIIEARIMAGHARTAAAFAVWLRNGGGDDLVQAADLLEPSDHLSELRALRSLLQLERADVLGSLEALLFALLDPDDPRADDARICAEAVARGVAALEASPAAYSAAVDDGLKTPARGDILPSSTASGPSPQPPLNSGQRADRASTSMPSDGQG